MIRSIFDTSKSIYPINIDLFIKLLAFIFLTKSYLHNPIVKLPFFDFLYTIDSVLSIKVFVAVISYVGAILVFINVFSRLGAGMIALAICITIAACRPCYSDSSFYIFSLFFLVSLYPKGYGMRILQIQVVILYLGSGVNKLFDADWQTGQYIENWLTYKIESSAYLYMASLIPSMFLAKVIAWMVIVMEMSIAFILLVKRRFFKIAIFIGILMHAGSIIAINGVWGAFVAGVFVSYLVFVEWPSKVSIILPKNKISSLIVKFKYIIDPYRIIKFSLNPISSRVLLNIEEKKYSGFQALQQFIIYCPLFHAIIVAIVLIPLYSFNWLKGVFLIGLAFMMLPIVGKLIDKLKNVLVK